ncbi:MAG TPA: polysaccharide deacetylase family protein [Hyphomicrobiaceae bacterium]|nr:polysaccharide deacetylase family protein [Hyphomicrobiaceae bacterium]
MPWKDGYTISDERSLPDADVRWPDGKRCAVHIVVDLSVAGGPQGITARDVAGAPAQLAAGDGLHLLCAALAKRGLRATFAVPAVMAEIYPDKIRALAEEGHEVAANGLRHEDVSALAREDEKARLALATEILTGVTGRRPAGWFSLPRQTDAFAGGTISPHTMDLLIEAGYAYFGNGLADDIPHYWVTDFASRRAILALPYYYHFDDQFFCMFPVAGTGLDNPDMLVRNWRAELDAQYRRGRFFTMTLHPQHVGWCHRMELLEDFLDDMTRLPDLWNPTGSECAGYWTAAYPAATHLKLEPSIWQDYPGSLS